MGGIHTNLRPEPRHGGGEVEVIDRGVFDDGAVSGGIHAVVMAQITSSQERAFTSSSVTMMNLVYMNWRKNDHTPNITRFA